MKNNSKKWAKEYVSLNTHSMVIIGMLIAIEIVLTRFVSIQAWNLRIGFGFVPIAIAGMMYGPIRTGMLAAIADVLGALLFPSGTFFLGFTLTALLIGIVYGVFLYKGHTMWKIILSVVMHQCVLSLFLNTLWLSILYGTQYWPLFTTRLIQSAVMIPVEMVCIVAIFSKKISRVLAFK